ncbi:Hint domain-containing protein [Paracoccus aminophilus]|uniref:Hemolysin-type calcium-binding protein n=1 Tax=Paracoccus aminophilus JCM 7686 TaxID=1367847 RepID=S5YFC4_PARAH|nr:Hint domain-containing protein [Paracoccus aminophilus]AGT10178.1 hemolysin-type calcium-binding protein [Paracoccus aminophilus JCM 7686]
MAQIDGTPIGDTLTGGSADDIIYGGAGDDVLYGGDGNDILYGGDDNDVLYGGDGADTLYGGPGDDTLYGGSGQDVAYVDDNSGHDTIDLGTSPNISMVNYVTTIGPGNDEPDDGYVSDVGDKLDGSAITTDTTVVVNDFRSGDMNWGDGNGSVHFIGAEHIYTGSGNDVLDARNMGHRTDGATGYYQERNGVGLHGGAGDDTIYGSDLRDTLDGGVGNDIIYGGGGDDLILSSAGDDIVYGGDGNDGIRWSADGGTTLNGGTAYHDIAYAGAGDNDALNMLEDASGTRNIHVTITATNQIGADGHAVDDRGNTIDFYEFNRILTSGGNDFIDASHAQVSGGVGVGLFAGDGDDTVYGSDGNDVIFAGTGTNVIRGGKGDDSIVLDENSWNPSHDTVIFRNGDGHDTISGVRPPESDGNGGYNSQLHINISGQLDANGNPISVNDIVVDTVDENGTNHVRFTFPSGDTIILKGDNYSPLDPTPFHDPAVLGSIFELTPICFARGTLLECAEGLIAVEALAVGDLVRTRDHGLRPIRWIGHRQIGAQELARLPNLMPIRIRAGALAAGVPSADLTVSPQHRILVRSAIAQRMFGVDEVLVAAKQLLALDGIELAEVTEVEYFHLLFEDHEILFSNGAETESLFTGEEALKSVGIAAQHEIFTLFPELRHRDAAALARPVVSGKKARQMAERHQRNHRPLLDPGAAT